MTRAEFDTYLVVVAVFAGVLGVVNALRPQKRWLGIGAIFVGIAAVLYRQTASVVAVAVPCVLAVLCMAKDVTDRQGRRA